MDVRVLGGVDLVGSTLGPKERALLCRLVVASGRAVPTDELVAVLWTGTPPRTAAKTLQGNILRLRKALAVAGGRADNLGRPALTVVSSPGGYALCIPDPDSVDLRCFDRLIAGARAAIALREPEDVIAALRTALALWRGPPFGEFADREWVMGERRRLEESFVAAREDLIEAELGCGRHHAVVAELEPMVASEPLRERSWEQLALALYRCGRQAEALRAIQRARNILSTELGVEPGPGLKTLEHAILAHDVSLMLGAPDQDADRTRSRRTVSFLFADLTENGPRRNEVAKILCATIRGGGGDLLASVEATVHAVFATASSAIDAAVSAMSAVSAAHGDEHCGRMAVDSGEAELVRGVWTGRVVQRCERVLRSGLAGQILVSHAAARLAEFELDDGVRLVSLGTRVADGVDGAEEVFQVVASGANDDGAQRVAGEWASDGDEGPAVAGVLPSSLARHIAATWVGRDRELEILRSSWRDASTGLFRMVLVAGEPGAGKTGLAAQFAAEAAAGGASVVHGRCDEGAVRSYRAFVEILEQVVSNASGKVLAEHTARHGGDLLPVVPLLATRVPGLRPMASTTPEGDRNRLASAVVGLLAAEAIHRRLLVVLDDLHWADSGTVGLLRELVHQAPDAPLLVVATYRNTDVEPQQPAAPLLGDLRRQPGVERVALTGLSPHDVIELLQAMAGQPLDNDSAAFASSLCRDTDGNPFFIIEVVRHLTETGDLRLTDGQWSPATSTLNIPEGIREVVGRRLDRLERGIADALRAASVIGPIFDLRVLAEVVESSPDRILELLESAGDAHLVSEVVDTVDCWQFTHELVRRTLLDQLSLSRTARTHLVIAQSLERVRPHELAALARHYAAAAGLGELERALHYGTLAADRAAAAASHGDAARLLEHAMDAADAAGGLDEHRKLAMLIRIGAEKAKAGDAEAAIACLDHAIESARAQQSPELLAQAVLARTSYDWSFDANSDQRQLISASLAAGPLTSKTRAQLLAAKARVGAYSTETTSQKRADVVEAVSAARIIGDPDTIGAALMSSVYLESGPDDVAARQAELDELVAAARAAHRPDWEAIAWGFLTDCHLIFGRYANARAAENEQRRVAVTSRDPFAVICLSEISGRRACLNGDFEAAERHAAEQTTLGARIGISADVMNVTAAGIYVPVWNLQGRLDEIEHVLSLVPDIGEWKQMHDLWTASLRARQGRFDEASELLGPPPIRINHGRSWGAGIDDATTAIVHLDAKPLAESLLEQLDAHRELDCVLDCVQYRGAVAHHIGRLLITCERVTEAVEQLENARARYEQLRSPPWLVLVQRDLARALRARTGTGDAALAGDLERESTRQARALGMIPAITRPPTQCAPVGRVRT